MVLIPGQVISKTQKMVLDATLFNNHHYKERIKGKWNNPGKGVAPALTPWQLKWVVLDYSHPTYVCVCVCVCV